MRHDVFVTGGTGYIGRALLAALCGRDHVVRALVRPGSERRLPPNVPSVMGDALDAGVRHLVYVSVAQPAPIMRAYVAVRAAVEDAIHATYAAGGPSATILRPWYVLGPGHRWPHLLRPLYALGRLFPSTRDGAERLGLVTHAQMVAALVRAVERPPTGIEIVDVPAIRQAR